MIPEAEDQALDDLEAVLTASLGRAVSPQRAAEVDAQATVIVARRLGRIERGLRDLTEAVRENTRFGK